MGRVHSNFAQESYADAVYVLFAAQDGKQFNFRQLFREMCRQAVVIVVGW
jgi:hypothetical protein